MGDEIICKQFCGGVAALVFVVLMSMSFSRLHYYEIGLVQRRSTGTVYRDTVYSSGNHFLGPDYRFITFPATAQTLEFSELSVWTKSSEQDAGTAMLLDVSMQYFLVKEELPKLYETVALNYESLIRNLALNTLKNNATQFSADEWVQNRRMIQDTMTRVVNSAIHAAHARCSLLQLRKVQFPQSFVERRLDAAIQGQRNAEEAYKQTATITRATTSKLSLEIENKALLVERTAEAEAALIEAKAENRKRDFDQRARSEGLFLVTEELEITAQSEVVSLDYQMRLKESDAKMFVDFPFVATKDAASGDG